MAKLGRPPLLQRIIQDGLNFPSAAWAQWFTGVERRLSTQFIGKITASDSKSIIITDLPTDYTYLELTLDFILPETTSRTLQLYGSVDNGTTYITATESRIASQSSNSGYVTSTISGTYIALSTLGAISNSTTGGVCGTVKIFTNSTATQYSQVIIDTSYEEVGVTDIVRAYGAGHYQDTGRLNAIKIQFDTGNIVSGTVSLHGRRGQ